MKKYLFLVLCCVAMLPATAKKLFDISAAGENLAALTQVTDNKFPCITPYGGDNGKDLYYAVNEDGRYYNIYKKDNPFSNATSQKTSGRNFNFSPCYNAATDRIAFRCQNEGMSAPEICTMPNTKGKALTQVTETQNAYEGNPCYSKDGKMIVYDRQKYSTVLVKSQTGLGFILGIATTNYYVVEQSELWVKNLITGENTLLGNGYQPQFSPDGTKIAFVKYSPDARSTNIWIMDADGSNLVQITDAKKGFASYPRWSPKGDKLVFQLSKKDKRDADIYTIDVDGNNLTQLTINNSHDGTPYWTSDNYLYFVSDRGNAVGNYQIWRFKMEED